MGAARPVAGRRRVIGLGGVEFNTFKLPSEIGNDVPLEQRKKLTLAEVRELAARLRHVAKAGRDRVTERMKSRTALSLFSRGGDRNA